MSNPHTAPRAAAPRVPPARADVAPDRIDADAEAHVDESLDESFPASDPPSWTLGAPAWARRAVAVAVPVPAAARPLLQRWAREHENVRRMLLVIESQLEAVHVGDGSDLALLRDLVGYLIEYVEAVHRPREDAAFRLLGPHRADLAPTLEAIDRAHRTLVRGGASLRDAAARAMADTPVPRRAIEAAGWSACSALRRHLTLEEEVLFPALTALADDEWTALVRDAGAPLDDVSRGVFAELARRAECTCAFA